MVDNLAQLIILMNSHIKLYKWEGLKVELTINKLIKKNLCNCKFCILKNAWRVHLARLFYVFVNRIFTLNDKTTKRNREFF